MGLSFRVAPNMGDVRFSDDPLPVNTDFQIVVCIGAPANGKTTGCRQLATRLARMGYDVIFVHESATDVLESVATSNSAGSAFVLDCRVAHRAALLSVERHQQVVVTFSVGHFGANVGEPGLWVGTHPAAGGSDYESDFGGRRWDRWRSVSFICF